MQMPPLFHFLGGGLGCWEVILTWRITDLPIFPLKLFDVSLHMKLDSLSLEYLSVKKERKKLCP